MSIATAHSRLELLVLTATFPIGPGEAFLTEELRALVAQACRVTVVPLWPRGQSQREIASMVAAEAMALIDFKINALVDGEILVAALAELLTSPLRVGGWLGRLLCRGPLRIRLKNVTVLPKALWLARHLRSGASRHLHVHWAGTTATCAMIAADLAKVPWSMTCHRWDIYEANLLAEKGNSAAFVRFISQRGLLDGVDLGIPKEKARVIHMGVRCADLPPDVALRVPGSPFRVICAANLVPVKGHRYLLEAVALLARRGCEVSLSIAGDGDLREALIAQAHSLGIGESVAFLGHVDRNELLAAYRNGRYDAFVLPSIELKKGEHEGVPVSLMEAMANGVPVLSTQTGSIGELLPIELGATVPGENSDALAFAIERLASDPVWRVRCRERQFQIVRDWSSDRSATQLRACIEGACARAEP